MVNKIINQLVTSTLATCPLAPMYVFIPSPLGWEHPLWRFSGPQMGLNFFEFDAMTVKDKVYTRTVGEQALRMLG